MSAIGPGDWVECVNDVPWNPGSRFNLEEAIHVGVIYQVSDTFVDWKGRPVVELVGRDRSRASLEWGHRVGYVVRRFRPIYRPKADLIESLKTPAKREGVPA